MAAFFVVYYLLNVRYWRIRKLNHKLRTSAYGQGCLTTLNSLSHCQLSGYIEISILVCQINSESLQLNLLTVKPLQLNLLFVRGKRKKRQTL